MLGDILSGGVDLISGNKAANIQRRATRKAGEYIDQGYQGAQNALQPFADQSKGDYLDLSQRYGEGAFRNP